ncbi:hypothetical protein CAL7716_075760 [Calothrix sp. PCC 7716]|nr:hypothetical protein CAL7716_075760 [Calothrix sp. PCC 7716]
MSTEITSQFDPVITGFGSAINLRRNSYNCWRLTIRAEGILNNNVKISLYNFAIRTFKLGEE